MSKLLLIDGSSLMHRAFYALPLLSNNDGVFTNAVHGFMMMFNRVLAGHKPDYVVVCFDKSRITFRNTIFPEYKGTRQETPSELKGQFELIQQVLTLDHIKNIELDNYEADDLIGTFASQGESAGFTVEIFSGDRDLLQLLSDRTAMFMTRKGISEIERWDSAAVQEKYSVTPAHVTDLKGLMGDSSDNIPGVPGVGEKTAVKLLSQYGDLDTLYAHLDEVGGKLGEKLATHRESAFLSRQLATICRQVPLTLVWEDCAYQAEADRTELAALYQKLGLRQLAHTLAQKQPPPTVAKQGALFDVQADDANRPWPVEGEAYAEIPAGACAVLPVADTIMLAAPGSAPAVYNAETHGSLLADASLRKICADSKAVWKWAAAAGVKLQNVADDITIAAYLLDPARGSYDLADLLQEANLPAGSAEANCSQLPALAALLRQKLADCHMTKLYEEMELPLTAVLAEMEHIGIRVERERLAALSAEFALLCNEYQEKIFLEAKHEFNLNSPKQLGVVLFEEMGIPAVKKTRTGYSTDAEVLETLALTQPIARYLLDYRLVAKLRSTYTEGLAKLIGPDERLHTTFTQTVTATGRLSSIEPNLQNIPIRQEQGRRIRAVFTADSAEDQLLAADYNQIELRILAHISGDERLCQAYRDNEDIHTRTAAEVLGVSLDQVTPVERRAAKAVNFGIVYGISDYGLSQNIGVSRKEAAAYIARYFERYPDVAAYQRRVIEEARKQGYVETLFGRRRYLPDLKSSNYNLRSFAERVAINAPIQGTAADVIKLAMVAIWREMQARQMRSKLLLQVHDELIFNVEPEEMPAMLTLVKEKMEGTVALSIPLTVSMKTGFDWYHMEKVD